MTRLKADNPKLIAPCGLNCGLCRAYIRDRNPCPGCRTSENCNSNAHTKCAIKNCTKRGLGKHQFCTSCAEFPCTDLLRLAKRYRANYGINVVANLLRIQSVGVENFVVEEVTKWSCPSCGSYLCMHKPQCPHCGHTSQ